MWNIGPMEALIILLIAAFLLAPVVAVGALAWFLYRSFQKNRIDRDPRSD